MDNSKVFYKEEGGASSQVKGEIKTCMWPNFVPFTFNSLYCLACTNELNESCMWCHLVFLLKSIFSFCKINAKLMHKTYHNKDISKLLWV
jgi:hypothetical protein